MMNLTFRKIESNPDQYAFIDENGVKRGPAVKDRITALAFITRLFMMNEIRPRNTVMLKKQIDDTFDEIKKATGTEPTVNISFVMSRSGQHGVFVIRETGDKLLETVKNAAYGKILIDTNLKAGVISADNAEQAKGEVDEVFTAIAPHQHIEYELTLTRSGVRAIILHHKGQPATEAYDTKDALLADIEDFTQTNKINDPTRLSLRQQADQVFERIGENIAKRTETEKAFNIALTRSGSAVLVVANGHNMTSALRTMKWVDKAMRELEFSAATRERLSAQAKELFDQIEQRATQVEHRFVFDETPDQGVFLKEVATGRVLVDHIPSPRDAKVYVQDKTKEGEITALEAYRLQQQIERLAADVKTINVEVPPEVQQLAQELFGVSSITLINIG